MTAVLELPRPRLSPTEQVDGPKPDQKRCPGPMHHGAGRQRGLVAAIPALIQFSLGNEIVLMMPTVRTHKTLRPAKIKEPLLTILFALIFLLEFQKVRLSIRLFHLVIPAPTVYFMPEINNHNILQSRLRKVNSH